MSYFRQGQRSLHEQALGLVHFELLDVLHRRQPVRFAKLFGKMGSVHPA